MNPGQSKTAAAVSIYLTILYTPTAALDTKKRTRTGANTWPSLLVPYDCPRNSRTRIAQLIPTMAPAPSHTVSDNILDVPRTDSR